MLIHLANPLSEVLLLAWQTQREHGGGGVFCGATLNSSVDGGDGGRSADQVPPSNQMVVASVIRNEGRYSDEGGLRDARER